METAMDPDQVRESDDIKSGFIFGSPCPPGAKAIRIGRETLRERSTDKWTCESPGEGKLTVWFDEWLKTIIRSEDREGGFELTNIREGRQSAELFEPPRGYTRFSMPGTPGFQVPPTAPQASSGPPVQQSKPAPVAQEERKEEKSGAQDLIRGVREGLKGILGR